MDEIQVPKNAIRQGISGVLARFNIDDLALECELATVVYGWFQRLESGESPEAVRKEMLDQFMEQHDDLRFRDELVKRIGNALKINIVDETNWERTLNFLTKTEQDKGQTIEGFARWKEDQSFSVPTFKIAQRPIYIIELWPQAFPEATQTEMFQHADGGFDF